jgi:hypothetical protein
VNKAAEEGREEEKSQQQQQNAHQVCRVSIISSMYYATSQKVEGSTLDEANFLNLPNPSGRTRHWDLLSL